jgi:hypothetical protein
MYDSQTFDSSSPFLGKPRSNHVAALKGASSHAALQNRAKKPHGKRATSSDGGRPPKKPSNKCNGLNGTCTAKWDSTKQKYVSHLPGCYHHPDEAKKRSANR